MEEKMKAFPNGNEITDEAGMNLRDYFAIRIYTKLMELETNSVMRDGKEGYEYVYEYKDSIAGDAYTMADVMMEVRK